jgi:phosphoribosylanthranilate isomerase
MSAAESGNSSLENLSAKPTLMLKVCGMRSAANMQEVIALEPDYLGLIFYPKSARFVGEKLDAEFLSNLPTQTKKVGVFVNETIANILAAVAKYKLEAVQLHGKETPALCKELKEKNLIVLKAFSVDDYFDFNQLEAYEGTCDYYLFDTKGQQYGGNGTTFNWEILDQYRYITPFFLSGGIDLDHAAEIKKLKLPLLKGIDINSKFEISPALKDANKIKSFFEQVREG